MDAGLSSDEAVDSESYGIDESEDLIVRQEDEEL